MLISLDLETTGFSSTADKIIEFGAIKFDPNDPSKRETLQILINPGHPLPQIIPYITGITDEHLKDAPPFEEKRQEIQDFIGDCPIIGHNIQFDTGFLKQNGIPLTNAEYDTHDLASILLPGLPSYSLEVLSKILKLTHEDKHRALDDSIAAMELFLRIKEEFEKLSPELLKKFQELSLRSSWGFKDFLQELEATGSKSEAPKPKIAKLKEVAEAKQILEATQNTLFQANPPYQDLIKDLASKAHKDSYVSIPWNIFQNIDIPDNVAKVDLPENYISPTRLADFEKQEFYEDHEIISLLAYLVWIEQTETGHLSEVRLKGPARDTIPKVQITDSKDEPFYKKAMEKDADSPAICTHNFIYENPQEDIIIIDMEEFIKGLHFKLSTYITSNQLLSPIQNLQKLEPENKVVEALIAKATILFGLVGLIFQNHNDRDEYTARSMVTNDLFLTKEWTDAKKATQNLIEISHDLKDIVSPLTFPYLTNWKESLKSLHEIFFNPELDKNLVWVEENYLEEIVARKIPFNTTEKLNEILKNYKAVSETPYFHELDPLPTQVKLAQKPENLEITAITDLQERSSLPEFITQHIENNKGLSAVIFNSRKQLEFVTLLLKEKGLPILSQLTGSVGKLSAHLDTHLENDAGPLTLLITPNTWQKIDHHEKFSSLLIHKLPFEPPSDPFLTALSHSYNDAFNELQVPRAVNSLMKAINRLTIDKTSAKEVYILDPRLTTKRYGNDFVKALEELAPLNVKKFSKFQH